MLATSEQRTVTCIIPATRISMLDEVVESIANQSAPVKDIVVVIDDPALEWESRRADVRVVHSPKNEGKVLATMRGCGLTDSNLILSVDDDTILPMGCLEHLLLHLQDEIAAVCARIEPLDTAGWIGRVRNDLYRKSHTRPGLINGACFLMKKKSFEETYPSLTTLVEDQELTRVLNKPYRHWMVCQETTVKTREPKSLTALFRQLVRWGYGTRELDAKYQGRGYRTFIAAGFLVPALSVAESAARGFDLALGAVVFWSLLFLVPGTMLQVRRYYSKGASVWRLTVYSFVEVVALVVAALRFVVNSTPKW